jgi:ribonuclease HI
MRVIIYTDGGADPNPGVGGWAAILKADGREKILTGNDPWTTNNRMELQAAVAALGALKRPAEVKIFTDSEYLSRGITEWITRWNKDGWKRKGQPIPNADLWQELWKLEQEHEVEWKWVRGHAGNPMNERADRLATAARQEIVAPVIIESDAPRLFVRASCKGNPGPGGWGVVLQRANDTEQVSGSEPKTTNNRMELVGVIEGLRLLPRNSEVIVYSTSDYVLTGATRWVKGWRSRNWLKRDGKPVSNLDLWQELDRLMSIYRIKWVSSKGKTENRAQGLIEASHLAAAAIDLER